MSIIKNLKTIVPAAALLMACTVACDSPNREEIDSDAGTSEAIIEDDNNLAEPRPAPIGDTADSPEDQDQFGTLKSNQEQTRKGKVK
ncbi:MAG: hypothetical protein LPJ89_03455 [Hymenobacteraceae bacterium]|nr:hypothetical protein [Hymenobacteraceae bacterium]MDX5396217.1 hypothetical protein [Hymenobacteraceae bacterium]MDX5442820.1 hypothetical protein [Hymenobacteraceae bacterium]MDX5512280.1 hypothetical protein [Hymenobacteraceae bacterium]